jgi:hypothetical protein
MVRRLRTGVVVGAAPNAEAASIDNATPVSAETRYSRTKGRYGRDREGDDDHALLLNPQQASDHLRNKWNLSRGPRRLAELRVEGTGPRYFRAGNEVRYKSIHLDEYAIKTLGEPLSSTSEEAIRRLRATARK